MPQILHARVYVYGSVFVYVCMANLSMYVYVCMAVGTGEAPYSSFVCVCACVGGGGGAGEAPYAGLKFCMYEAMKRSLAKLWGVEEEDLGSELNSKL